MTIHQLSRQDARRIAVLAQWLSADRPPALLALVGAITMLQLDPTAAIAPSAELVAWSRLGSAFDRAELVQAVRDRTLIELRATLRPAEDLALYRGDMAALRNSGPHEGREAAQVWIAANDVCRRDILQRLTDAGPLPSRDLPDRCEVPWQSTGWTNNRNVTIMLTIMAGRGEVAVAGRLGKERLWDLAERVYPDDPVVPVEEAARLRDRRRLSALGIARARGTALPVEPTTVGDTGVEAVVDGVKGVWRVDPALLGQPFSGRAALLSPFDRLLHDRARIAELFEFEYILEMYKPVAARRWGYFALPVLYGDRLVGKLDATADRKAGVLRVNALHWDVDTSAAMVAAVDREIDDLAIWLDLARTS